LDHILKCINIWIEKTTNHACMDILGTIITTYIMTKISIVTCSLLSSSTKVVRSSKFVNW
jgi:hypothetical protein